VAEVFECGCKFEVLGGDIIYDPNIETLPLNCEHTWDIISEGNTKGVFQLESQLGRSMSEKVKPRNIEELSDLIAIIRPGCMEAIVDGKSLTQHYIDRKQGIDPVEYFHGALKPILSSTYGILVYQEQALLIARDIGGFNLQEADILRKAIGKKNVSLMAELRNQFIEKAEVKGTVNKEQAEEIFGWIEKSQRYSFNKSHSVSYAYNAYLTAYTKQHFPHEFFTAYLKHSIGKPDAYLEIEELVNNARLMNIHVQPPNIKQMNKYFTLVIDTLPTFGITEIKGVGGSVYDKMVLCLEKNKIDLKTCDWDTFLIGFGPCIKVDAFEALILSGALDCFKISRSKMNHELKMFRELSKREIPWIEKFKQDNAKKNFTDCIQAMLDKNDWSNRHRPIFRKDRVEVVESIIDSLNNPGYELVDLPGWKARQEEKYLGVSLTCARVDEYDTSGANCTCKEYVDGFNCKGTIRIAAQVDGVREWKIKKGNSKGQNMGFVTISDGTCSLDSVTVFSEEWNKYAKDITEGNVLLLIGSRDKKRGSFLIKSVSKVKNLA
jgi:DNA polymerase III alpha subunit